MSCLGEFEKSMVLEQFLKELQCRDISRPEILEGDLVQLLSRFGTRNVTFVGIREIN